MEDQNNMLFNNNKKIKNIHLERSGKNGEYPLKIKLVISVV